ncbi:MULTISPECIES: GNAT family N-acetyltransferase [Salimicrobium]|uniref:GNAT family N-acetyltransferase n=1 Tax=Salimicrobium humidisoli TaxID=2029857 RepID=A0ABX4HP40_9BACI|nr:MULTISPECIES: GNAT family N-acetyltransferase [Salimicrobium]PBB04954.1 GNAT family N-acetyltransferase [Salimicrobium humidisoli]
MKLYQDDKRFFAGDSDNPEAYIHFEKFGDDKLIVDHTYVGESMRGQGAGKQLVEAVVNYAREENKKIVAHCPYTRDVLTNNEEYHDVFIGIHTS